MAIIVSSHILSELESFCNKICIINKGKILNYTNIKKLYNSSFIYFFLELSRIDLNNCLNNYEIVDDSHIKVKINGNINTIIKILLDNNITIYEIKKEVLSLEDIFMSLVGGNTID